MRLHAKGVSLFREAILDAAVIEWRRIKPERQGEKARIALLTNEEMKKLLPHAYILQSLFALIILADSASGVT